MKLQRIKHLSMFNLQTKIPKFQEQIKEDYSEVSDHSFEPFQVYKYPEQKNKRHNQDQMDKKTIQSIQNHYKKFEEEIKQDILRQFNQQLYQELKGQLLMEAYMLDQAIETQQNLIMQINNNIDFYSNLEVQNKLQIDYQRRRKSIEHYQPIRNRQKNIEIPYIQVSKIKQQHFDENDSVNGSQRHRKSRQLSHRRLIKSGNGLVNKQRFSLNNQVCLNISPSFDAIRRQNDRQDKNDKDFLKQSKYNIKNKKSQQLEIIGIDQYYIELERAYAYLSFLKNQSKKNLKLKSVYLQQKTKIKFMVQQIKNAISLADQKLVY